MSRLTRLALATIAFAVTATPAYASSPMNASVTLSDSEGTATHQFTCAWSEGAPEDRDCRDIVGDASSQIELIERHGAASSTATIRSEDGKFASDVTVSRRDDGTWLMRGRGTSFGRPHQWGFVCTAAGTGCVPWVVSAQASDHRTVRATSASIAIRRAARRVNA